MADFKKREDFKHWFVRIGTSNLYEVFDTSTGRYICILHRDDLTKNMEDIPDYYSVMGDWSEFQKRPEFIVGDYIDRGKIRNINEDTVHDVHYYEDLIRGIYYIMLKNDDKAEAASKRCLDWLATTDFYTAPASTKYHESYPCGLYQHHLMVYSKTVELLNTTTFTSVTDAAPALLTSLVHDWCKINLYEQYFRNVKDDDGVWHKERAYKCNSSKIPLGHGVTSMYMAMKFFNLSVEQALAIRWHMSAFNMCQNESYDLMDASENYLTVRLLQLADQMSIIRDDL